MRYTVEIGGSSWSRGPVLKTKSLREAREIAESYGTTADFCHVKNRKGELCAAYNRDTSGNGLRWYRSQ